jgi:predicted permease
MLTSLRHAIRLWRQTPGITLVCVCSLAIGIGATSAMFSFADGLLLRPLAVHEPSRVVAVASARADIFSAAALSYPDYRDYRDGNRTFDGMIAASFTSFGFQPDAKALPKVAYGLYVSGNFFRVLGVEPVHGRGFLDSEDQAVGRDAVVVLGHDYWQSQFHGDAGVIGSSIRLNGVPFTIVGIAPEQFTGIDTFVKVCLFVPIAMSPRLGGENTLERRDVRSVIVKGRLKPGAGIAQASADMASIARRLEQMYPQTNRNQSVEVETEFELRVRQSPPNAALVAMLLVLALIVLAVACANVTGLLLSRARARAREMAVRLAIGAGRGPLVRQLFLENLLLAIAGGAAGIAVAYAGIAFFGNIPIPSDIPLAMHFSVDKRMLIFTLAVSLASTFLFGLTPALQTTRLNLVTALKTADADSGVRRKLWGRNLIVSGQVALSLVLLIVSAVLLQGFRDQLLQGPGFRTDHLWLTSFDTQPIHYTEEQNARFYKDLLAQTRLAPGVRSAALLSDVPLLNAGTVGVIPEGFTLAPGQHSISIPNYYVSPSFFATMAIPVLRGREFQDSDAKNSPLVAVVNQHMADHFWPRQDAIGKRFRLNNDTGPMVQVVGVVKVSKYFWIAEPPMDFLYLPYTQHKQTAMTIAAETAAPDAATLAPVLREVVRGIDAGMPVFNTRTMQDFYTQRSVKTPAILTQTVAAMGTMGLILATVGLYGLIAYSVSRRRREIGIRMAIGADRTSVVRMILRQGLTLGSAGVAVGLIVSFFACRALISVMWIATFDHLNYALFPAIAIPLLVITLLASFAPARRASLVDPMRALREE